jgi:organic hydroperoxide reductase OsmC/OhrA
MIELVWDAGRFGTATAPSGAQVTVGEDAHFTPDDLLALATSSCLMRTFLRLTESEQPPILSFAATARPAPACETGASAGVTIHVYLVVSAASDAAAVRDRFHRSVRVSPIAQLLGDRLTVTSDVRVLRPASADN